MEQGEAVWREGKDYLVRGRRGQATLTVLAFASVVMTAMVILAVLMTNQLAGGAANDWLLGDSLAHFAGWGAAVLVVSFIAVLLTRLLFLRDALAWRTARIRLAPEGLDVDGRLFPYKDIRSIAVNDTASLSSGPARQIGIFMLVILPADSLARALFGRIQPDAFAPLPHQMHSMRIGWAVLRLYVRDRDLLESLANQLSKEVHARQPPPVL